jgi:hypothetical protein
VGEKRKLRGGKNVITYEGEMANILKLNDKKKIFVMKNRDIRLIR